MVRSALALLALVALGWAPAMAEDIDLAQGEEAEGKEEADSFQSLLSANDKDKDSMLSLAEILGAYMDPKDKTEVHELFMKADADKDGKLSAKEFASSELAEDEDDDDAEDDDDKDEADHHVVEAAAKSTPE